MTTTTTTTTMIATTRHYHHSSINIILSFIYILSSSFTNPFLIPSPTVKNNININSQPSFITTTRIHNHRCSYRHQHHHFNYLQSSTTLLNNKNNDDDGTSEQQRMKLVRQIQNTYYAPSYSSSSSSSQHGHHHLPIPILNITNGIIHNLPLWTVPWAELPGRTNVLNVHEACYTNMFETILRRTTTTTSENQDEEEKQPSQWYFGHLYRRPRESNDGIVVQPTVKNINNTVTVNDNDISITPHNTTDDDDELTTIVGTLMRITDYRRLTDGRLCLLVQGLERFVLLSPLIQTKPYAIGHVQMVPDYDLWTNCNDDYDDPLKMEEGPLARYYRGRTVKKSFDYHAYEYDMVMLPVSKKETKEEMDVKDVYGSWMKDVIPLVPCTLNDDLLPSSSLSLSCCDDDEMMTTIPKDLTTTTTSKKRRLPSLEYHLLQANILRSPPSHPEIPQNNNNNTTTAEEWEQLVWNAIYDYCTVTKTPLPSALRCLLPPDSSLQQRQQQQPCSTTNDNDNHFFVSEMYPSERRQRLLSYTAPILLETSSSKGGRDLRQIWLETPTTEERLRGIWERLEMMVLELLGEYR